MGKCVYCCTPDVADYHSFGVDHYRPKKLRPDLEVEYLNLYYACNRCNTLKGTYWPNPAQEKKEMIIPNPCDHVMFDHLRYKAGIVNPQSKSGEWTIDKLDLNEEKKIAYREILINSFNAYQKELNVQKKLLKDIKRKHASASDKKEKIQLEAKERKVKEHITKLSKTLNSF